MLYILKKVNLAKYKLAALPHRPKRILNTVPSFVHVVCTRPLQIKEKEKILKNKEKNLIFSVVVYGYGKKGPQRNQAYLEKQKQPFKNI